MDKEEVVSCINLSKSFGNFYALKKVSFSIGKEEFFTIFGPNGAGKSTLLKMMAGIMKPSEGKVEIFKKDLYSESDGDSLRKKIGFISHSTFLYNNLTAYENLEFYGKLYNVSPLEDTIFKVLKEVELEKRAYSLAGTFSRGMQQRLTIARVLLHDPLIIFLDEPYTGLDIHSAENLTLILLKLREEGRTIILTTHDVEKSFKNSTSVAILSGGRLSFKEKKDGISLNEFKKKYEEILNKSYS